MVGGRARSYLLPRWQLAAPLQPVSAHYSHLTGSRALWRSGHRDARLLAGGTICQAGQGGGGKRGTGASLSASWGVGAAPWAGRGFQERGKDSGTGKKGSVSGTEPRDGLGRGTEIQRGGRTQGRGRGETFGVGPSDRQGLDRGSRGWGRTSGGKVSAQVGGFRRGGAPEGAVPGASSAAAAGRAGRWCCSAGRAGAAASANG